MEEVDHEGFGGLLERHDGLTLPSGGAVFSNNILRDLPNLHAFQSCTPRTMFANCTHQPRKGELKDEKVGSLLVSADLAQCDRAWLVALLRTVRRRAWFSNYVERQSYAR